MKYTTLVLMILCIGCGGAKSGSKAATVMPPAVGGSSSQIITTSRDATTSTPGSVTITGSLYVDVPQPADFAVIKNAAEFWHVSVQLGSQSCDFIHSAGSSTVGAGAGCTTSSPIHLNAGDTIVVTITTSVTQDTQSMLTITARN